MQLLRYGYGNPKSRFISVTWAAENVGNLPPGGALKTKKVPSRDLFIILLGLVLSVKPKACPHSCTAAAQQSLLTFVGDNGVPLRQCEPKNELSIYC